MDPVMSAQRAREGLARGLALLQSPGLPPSLSPIVEQVAQVMSLLHRIEATRGAAFAEAAPAALGTLRRALGELQALNRPELEVERALEAIAGSLGTIHELGQAAPGLQTQASAQMPHLPAPAAPGVSPYAGTMLEPHGNAPGRPTTPLVAPVPRHTPGHHHAPPPPPVSHHAPPAAPQYAPPPHAAPPPQPGMAPHYATQPSAAYPPPQAAAPYAAPGSSPHAAPQPQYPPPPATPYGAPPGSGWQQPQPGYQQQPAWQQPQPAPSPQQPPPAWHPPPAAAVPPQPAPVAPHPPAQDWQQPPASALRPPPANVGPGAPVRVEAALGAHSPTNFYKGLGGNDVIDAGGLFVATYQIPPIGTQVMLKVALPGGYEFEAIGVVRWARETRDAESDAPPGFGAQIVQITPEARDLVYRYVRNREPLFHDDN
jgi:hypothetical protein